MPYGILVYFEGKRGFYANGQISGQFAVGAKSEIGAAQSLRLALVAEAARQLPAAFQVGYSNFVFFMSDVAPPSQQKEHRTEG